MNILSVSAAIVIAALIAMLLKQYKPEYSLALSLFVSITALLLIMPYIDEVINFIKSFGAVIDQKSGLKALLRALGTAIVAELAYDICRDAGEQAMAKKIELAGKIAVIIMSLPLANELMGLLASVL